MSSNNEEKSKILYLFTSKFPYGNQEVFVKNELRYLLKYFNKIIITPLFPDTIFEYEIEKNIIVNPPLFPNSYFKRIIGSIYYKNSILKSFLKDFKDNKIYKNQKWFSRWIKNYINTTYLYRHHHKMFENINKGIVYFYWTSTSVSVLPFINKHPNVNYVTRLHGGDIYLNRSNGYSPIKKIILSSIDYLIPISKDIENYLISVYGIPKNKIFINRLGSERESLIMPIEKDEILRVVSCSSIIPIKRVGLIIDILKNIKTILVEWHHYGDGELLDDLIVKSKFLPTNIKVIFHGRIDNYTLLKNYSNIYYDVFINVSEHEGIPVSIMEAMSCGIPVIATDVGAVNEIVNNDNGLLIDKNFNCLEIAEIVELTKNDNWKIKRKSAYSFWQNNYNLRQNTTELVAFFDTII